MWRGARTDLFVPGLLQMWNFPDSLSVTFLESRAMENRGRQAPSRWQELQSGALDPDRVLRAAPSVTTWPPLPSAATRRSAAATRRSCQGDMRYAPPHY